LKYALQKQLNGCIYSVYLINYSITERAPEEFYGKRSPSF
jgi:hypothetical protein